MGRGAGSSSSARVMGRVAVTHARIAGPDVVVERPGAGDVAPRQGFLDMDPCVAGRPALRDDVVTEDDCHRRRELHPGAHVALALVDRRHDPSRIVFRVDPPVSPADRPACRAPEAFPTPGLRRKVANRREPSGGVMAAHRLRQPFQATARACRIPFVG